MKLFRIMPLRIMLLIAIAQSPITALTWREMNEYNLLLENFIGTLSIPATKLQRWAVTKIIEWADREKIALRQLMDLNVSNIGILPK